jgi:hypothetical protein
MLFIVIVAILASCLLGCTSSSDVNKRAPEGHGILPPIAQRSAPLLETGRRFAFHAESVDLSSRVLFQTDKDADFVVSVREYGLSPHEDISMAPSESDRVLEMWTDQGGLKIGGKAQEWRQGQMVMVPLGSSIELSNPTDRDLVIRLYAAETR